MFILGIKGQTQILYNSFDVIRIVMFFIITGISNFCEAYLKTQGSYPNVNIVYGSYGNKLA